jgi:hypothetical protein
MLNKIREIVLTLKEEIIYQDNIYSTKKNLEATLWGLQEQANMPENSSKNEQLGIKEEINKCMLRIKNCDDIISKHNLKLKEYLKSKSI